MSGDFRDVLARVKDDPKLTDQFCAMFTSNPEQILGLMIQIAANGPDDSLALYALILIGRYAKMYSGIFAGISGEAQATIKQILVNLLNAPGDNFLRNVLHTMVSMMNIYGAPWYDLVGTFFGALQQGSPVLCAAVLDTLNELISSKTEVFGQFIPQICEYIAGLSGRINTDLDTGLSCAILRMVYVLFAEQPACREVLAPFPGIVIAFITNILGNAPLLEIALRDLYGYLGSNCIFFKGREADMLALFLNIAKEIREESVMVSSIQLMSNIAQTFSDEIMEREDVMTAIVQTMTLVAAQSFGAIDDEDNIVLARLEEEAIDLSETFQYEVAFASAMQQAVMTVDTQNPNLQVALLLLFSWTTSGCASQYTMIGAQDLYNEFAVKFGGLIGRPDPVGYYALKALRHLVKYVGDYDRSEIPDIHLGDIMTALAGVVPFHPLVRHQILRCFKTCVSVANDDEFTAIATPVLQYCKANMEAQPALTPDDWLVVLKIFNEYSRRIKLDGVQGLIGEIVQVVGGWLSNPIDSVATKMYFQLFEVFVNFGELIPADAFNGMIGQVLGQVVTRDMADMLADERTLVNSAISKLIQRSNGCVLGNIHDIIAYILRGNYPGDIETIECTLEDYTEGGYFVISQSALTGRKKCISNYDLESVKETIRTVKDILNTMSPAMDAVIGLFVEFAQAWMTGIPVGSTIDYELTTLLAILCFWFDLSQPLFPAFFERIVNFVDRRDCSTDEHWRMINYTRLVFEHMCSFGQAPAEDVCGKIMTTALETAAYYKTVKYEAKARNGLGDDVIVENAKKAKTECAWLCISLAKYAPPPLVAQLLSATGQFGNSCRFQKLVFAGLTCGSYLNADGLRVLGEKMQNLLQSKQPMKIIFALEISTILAHFNALPHAMATQCIKCMEIMINENGPFGKSWANRGKKELMTALITLLVHTPSRINPDELLAMFCGLEIDGDLIMPNNLSITVPDFMALFERLKDHPGPHIPRLYLIGCQLFKIVQNVRIGRPLKEVLQL